MDAETPSGRETIEGIEIDYDHLDVAAIMTQVKRVASLNPGEPPEAEPEKPPAPPAPPEEPTAIPVIPAPVRLTEPIVSAGIPEPPGPPPVPPVPGRKAMLKEKFARAIRPFAPAIRLLGLPLHEDIQAAVRQIDATNQRLDEVEQRKLVRIDKRLDEFQDRTDQRLDKMQDRTDQRLDETQDRLDRRLDELQDRMDARFNEATKEFDDFRSGLDVRLVDLDRSIEYIKLLHNLDHNLVVEITKLRIEFETLKSRARILEKDLDAQLEREKILEKRLGS